MAASEAECNNEAYMNLGFQISLTACAAICALKHGNAFSYGVQGKSMCKGPCSCRCWYSCSSTKPSAVFHVYKFEGNTLAHNCMCCIINYNIIYDKFPFYY